MTHVNNYPALSESFDSARKFHAIISTALISLTRQNLTSRSQAISFYVTAFLARPMKTRAYHREQGTKWKIESHLEFFSKGK